MPDFEVRCDNVLDTVEITEDLVMKKLSALKVDKSQGPDGINPRILKECRSSIAKPLYIIFKKSLESGQLPSDFKNANISPIFKKRNRNSPENFRPVSITSVPCKILESIIRDNMTQHFESNNLVSKEQHGFVNITKTYPYNSDPLKPHFYVVKLGFTGVYVIFSYFCSKHRLCVFVRTASTRRF